MGGTLSRCRLQGRHTRVHTDKSSSIWWKPLKRQLNALPLHQSHTRVRQRDESNKGLVMEWKHSKTKQGQLSECRPFSCAWKRLGEKTVWVCVFWFKRQARNRRADIHQSKQRSDALHLAGRTAGGLCPSVQSDCRGEPWRSASCCRRCYSGASEKNKYI